MREILAFALGIELATLPVMSNALKWGLATSTLVLVVLVPTKIASGLSCVSYISEEITLELESVTEDGTIVSDTSSYDEFSVSLEGSPYGSAGFKLIAKTGESHTWLEQYQ